MSRAGELLFQICWFGVRVGVEGPPDRRAELAELFRTLIEDGEQGPAATEVRVQVSSTEDPVAILTEVTAAIVEHSRLLLIHAGVLATATGLVVIPAPSGTGKSTLTAALARAGFGYLSDEALGLDRVTGAASGLPRPISLAGDVWPLVVPEQADPPPVGQERLLPVAAFTAQRRPATGWPDRIDHILLPERSGDAPRLEPASATDAVGALLQRSFNHFRDPAASLRTVLDVARGASVWRAGYRQAPELAALLATRLGQPAADACR